MPYLHYISDHHCTNCKRNSDFQLLYAAPVTTRNSKKEGRSQWEASQGVFRGLFICGYCNTPHMIGVKKIKEVNFGGPAFSSKLLDGFLRRLNFIEADVKGRSPSYSRHYEIKSDRYGVDLRSFMMVEEVYPNDENESPAYLPAAVEDMYLELEDVKGSARYTLVACRKILETVCEYEIGKSSKTLIKQIEQLKEDGKLSTAIIDWAHTIRLLGNKAVHEDKKPEIEDSEEVKSFVKKILELLYTYPAKIEILKKKRNKEFKFAYGPDCEKRSSLTWRCLSSPELV